MAYLVVPDGSEIKLTQKQLDKLKEAREICNALSFQDLPKELKPDACFGELSKIIDHFTDDKPKQAEPEPPNPAK